MIKKIANTFFTRVAVALMNLAVAIIISNVLGAEGRGLQGLILSTITIITLLTAIIGAGSITYFTPRLPQRYLMLAAYSWNIILLLIVLGSAGIQDFISTDLFIHVGVLSFILSGSLIHSGILIGREKIIESNTVQLLSSILILVSISIMFFILKVEDIEAYVIALYIGYLLAFFISLLLLIKHPGSEIENPNISFKKAFVKFSGYGLLNQLDVIAQMLSFRFSYYLIVSVYGARDVGVYSNAVSIIESLWLISRSLSMVQHARIVNTKEKAVSKHLTLLFLKASSVAVLIACVILIVIPPDFYVFMFGKDFFEVKSVILTFLPGVLVFNASFIFSAFFSGLGKYQFNVYASVVGLFVTITSAMYLVPKVGIIGAGISASIAYIVTTFVKYIIFNKHYGIKPKDFLFRRHEIQELKRQLF
jgi:O-antigen/teichoic acid export membrane protein